MKSVCLRYTKTPLLLALTDFTVELTDYSAKIQDQNITKKYSNF